MISVVATANVIARPADFEIIHGASSAGSLSHILTMMRKYKNAATLLIEPMSAVIGAGVP